MNSKKLFYGLVGLLVLLTVGLFFGAREADVLLGNESKTLANLKAENVGLANQQVQLTKDKKDLAQYAELNKIAKSVVPQDKDQAEATREIVNLAAQSGIRLSTISFPPSTLGGTAGKKAAPGALTQVTPVKSIPGVYNLELTITQTPTESVPYSSFTSFLSKLENNRRTAQVTSITIQPDTKNINRVSFTLVIDEFIKP